MTLPSGSAFLALMRILVVEDNAAVQQAVALVLEQEGHTGDRLLAAVRENLPVR